MPRTSIDGSGDEQPDKEFRDHYARAVQGVAIEKIEAWRFDYDQRRPHSSLGDLTPGEFARDALEQTEKKAPGELSARAGH